jgi:hypothetical protein
MLSLGPAPGPRLAAMRTGRHSSPVVAATLAAACGVLATPLLTGSAAAASGHLKAAEEKIETARTSEGAAHVELEHHNSHGAEEELEASQDDLNKAIRDVEAAFAAGEVPAREAAEMILDLRDASAEDRKAEDLSGRLSDHERIAHVRRGIAHKRRAQKTLKSVLQHTTATTVTPPPTPSPIVDGSDLSGSAAPDIGDINEDLEMLNRIEKELRGELPKGSSASAARVLLDPFLAPARVSAATATSNVTVSGEITSYTVKGYTITSTRPGPNGSGEIRLGVDEPQANGQVKVLSTSNPPNFLPTTPGTYTFAIGPPATGFAMPVTKGDVVSLDTPGGNYAVMTSQPGASLESSQGHDEEQNPGKLWTLTAHPNLELLLQVTIEPSLPVSKLEEAEKALKEALAREHGAVRGNEKQVARALKKAGPPLKKADELVAGAGREGAVSSQTEASIDFYLNNAAADVRAAHVTKHGLTAKMFAYASAVDTQEALTRVNTAKSLAKKAP